MKRKSLTDETEQIYKLMEGIMDQWLETKQLPVHFASSDRKMSVVVSLSVSGFFSNSLDLTLNCNDTFSVRRERYDNDPRICQALRM